MLMQDPGSPAQQKVAKKLPNLSWHTRIIYNRVGIIVRIYIHHIFGNFQAKHIAYTQAYAPYIYIYDSG